MSTRNSPLGRRPMKQRWLGTALAPTVVVLVGSALLMAQTHFASFTGTINGKDASPMRWRRGRRDEPRHAGHLHGEEQQRRSLHDLRPADRHLQGPRPGAELPGVRDESHQARIRPERTRRHHAAGRVRAEHRGHRRDAHPPDAGRRGRRGHLGDHHRGHAAQRAQLLAALAAAARRDDDRARQLHRAQELRRRDGRS